MRRAALVGMGLVWLAMILACTGAGGKWFDLPGGQAVHRSDYRDYYFYGNNGVGQVGGHITHVGFDDRFILLRRDVCEHYSDPKPKHRLTGRVEFYVVGVSPPELHGPFAEAEFAAARERLGVPAGLELEPTDEVRRRLGPPRQ